MDLAYILCFTDFSYQPASAVRARLPLGVLCCFLTALVNSEMEYIYVCIHHNFQGWHRTHICKTNRKMFDSAKVMVGQRVIQYTHGAKCKKGSVV